MEHPKVVDKNNRARLERRSDCVDGVVTDPRQATICLVEVEGLPGRSRVVKGQTPQGGPVVGIEPEQGYFWSSSPARPQLEEIAGRVQFNHGTMPGYSGQSISIPRVSFQIMVHHLLSRIFCHLRAYQFLRQQFEALWVFFFQKLDASLPVD